ncbi:MAG: Rrf2 family transcriptional regulator [bacterium]|nr:Rrf2 family transcriptional regulator [bacterium]
MFLSQTPEYALRSMAWFVVADLDRPAGTQEISEATGIPRHYLAKVLRRLVLSGLLESKKGPGGGFALSRAPEAIRFSEILAAVDALPTPGRCAFGWGACNASQPCPLHEVWSHFAERCLTWAEDTTLAQVSSSGTLDVKDHLR